jgi:hypothetical protein
VSITLLPRDAGDPVGAVTGVSAVGYINGSASMALDRLFGAAAVNP